MLINLRLISSSLVLLYTLREVASYPQNIAKSPQRQPRQDEDSDEDDGGSSGSATNTRGPGDILQGVAQIVAGTLSGNLGQIVGGAFSTVSDGDVKTNVLDQLHHGLFPTLATTTTVAPPYIEPEIQPEVVQAQVVSAPVPEAAVAVEPQPEPDTPKKTINLYPQSIEDAFFEIDIGGPSRPKQPQPVYIPEGVEILPEPEVVKSKPVVEEVEHVAPVVSPEESEITKKLTEKVKEQENLIRQQQEALAWQIQQQQALQLKQQEILEAQHQQLLIQQQQNEEREREKLAQAQAAPQIVKVVEPVESEPVEIAPEVVKTPSEPEQASVVVDSELEYGGTDGEENKHVEPEVEVIKTQPEVSVVEVIQVPQPAPVQVIQPEVVKSPPQPIQVDVVQSQPVKIIKPNRFAIKAPPKPTQVKAPSTPFEIIKIQAPIKHVPEVIKTPSQVLPVQPQIVEIIRPPQKVVVKAPPPPPPVKEVAKPTKKQPIQATRPVYTVNKQPLYSPVKPPQEIVGTQLTPIIGGGLRPVSIQIVEEEEEESQEKSGISGNFPPNFGTSASKAAAAEEFKVEESFKKVEGAFGADPADLLVIPESSYNPATAGAFGTGLPSRRKTPTESPPPSQTTEKASGEEESIEESEEIETTEREARTAAPTTEEAIVEEKEEEEEEKEVVPASSTTTEKAEEAEEEVEADSESDAGDVKATIAQILLPEVEEKDVVIGLVKAAEEQALKDELLAAKLKKEAEAKKKAEEKKKKEEKDKESDSEEDDY